MAIYDREYSSFVCFGENTFIYLLWIQLFGLNWNFHHMQGGPEGVPSLTEEKAGQAFVIQCHEK